MCQMTDSNENHAPVSWFDNHNLRSKNQHLYNWGIWHTDKKMLDAFAELSSVSNFFFL